LSTSYDNVSMRRVAEKIEYSPTTIYLYFEDRASLLYAICEETFAEIAKRIHKQSDDSIETLKRGCRACVPSERARDIHLALVVSDVRIPNLAQIQDKARQLRLA
jgi:AcrR family transcriptional regulator